MLKGKHLAAEQMKEMTYLDMFIKEGNQYRPRLRLATSASAPPQSALPQPPIDFSPSSFEIRTSYTFPCQSQSWTRYPDR